MHPPQADTLRVESELNDMKRDPQTHINTRIRREQRDSRSARLLLAPLVICALLVAGGFVYTARQHYGAIKLGYKSEEMRREKARLIEEQSHLLVARERASSPARLESSARSIGMQFASPVQIEFQAPPSPSPSSRASGRTRMAPAASTAKSATH